MPPLVSIIVPTYNRAYCLPRTLDSALAQTHSNMEILVIDDGSTDDTRALIERRFSNETRVCYVYQENQRVAAARNLGLTLAQGDYVAFLDSDDLWDTWKLELQVACMEQRPEVGMTWTDMRALNPEGEIVCPRFLRTMYSAYQWFSNEQLFSSSEPLTDFAPQLQSHYGDAQFYQGDIYSQMIMGNMVHTSTVLLRRERALKVGLFNTNYQPTGEDYDFHIRTCKLGQVGYLDLATMDYQVGMPDRLTRPSSHLAIATYFLEVIERELAQDRARITLPDSMIRAVLAEAHEWVGYAHFLREETRQARIHFRRSLGYNLRQSRTLRLYLSCFLAGSAFRSVRSAYHALRPRANQPAIH